MNRDDFLFTLREQYSEEIHTAYAECQLEGGKKTDVPGLLKKINLIRKSAKVQGLPEGDFNELVRAHLPEFAEKLGAGAKSPVKKAA